MMKFTITQDEYQALNDELKALYQEVGEGYQMQIEGLPDTTQLDGLKRKVDELMTEKKNEQAARRKAEEEAQKVAAEQARKTGDVEALEQSWQEKLQVRETELLAELDARDARLHTLLVDNEAQRLATELAGDNAPLILPHIKARLAVEEGKTRVLDAQGKPSAFSLEDLGKELRNTKMFAPVIIGSRATGTRGAGNNPDAGGEGYQPTAKSVAANPLVSRARDIIAKTQE